MICPMCEHQQDLGLECEVCGRELGGLAALGPPPVRTERLEGLEATLAERVGDVGVDPVPELQVTRFDPTNVAVERLAEVELQAQPVGEVPVEPMVDLSLDRAPDDGARTALPTGAVTCRYCRNVQAEGLMCDRCGMRLPRLSQTQEAAAAPKAKVIEQHVRCKVCGAPAVVGARCSECGRLVAPPEE